MKKINKCPKCGQTYTGHPAISRDDNKTNICPECGVREAFQAFCKEKGIDGEDL